MTQQGIQSAPADVVDRPSFHKFQIALMAGDKLVLTNYCQDESDDVQLHSTFELIRIEHTPRFVWEAVSSQGESFTAGFDSMLTIHPYVKLGTKVPHVKPGTKSTYVKLVNKPRGLCTVFSVAVQHGYALHLDHYIKSKQPELYEKLQLG